MSGGTPAPAHAPCIVAIDGYAYSGKSTAAGLVGRRLALRVLPTGAMYRAVTRAVLDSGVDPGDAEGCARVAGSLTFDFDTPGRLRAGERDYTFAELKSDEIEAAVSAVSEHPEVRARIVPRQRALAAQWNGAVAEGRDMTSVVFPETRHRFFLAASLEARALRRAREQGVEHDPLALERIRGAIARRDRIDSSRAAAPLVHVPGVPRIDTDRLAPAAVADEIVRAVEAAERSARSARA